MKVAWLSLGLFLTSSLCYGDGVETIAGTGVDASTGDSGPASQAAVAGPFGVTVGPDGALYICETTGHRIRRVDPRSELISTVVGTGERGNSGDGGPATAARIDEPYEIRFDAAGNLFFVDMTQHVVRRVDRSTQTITTVAGSGEAGSSGDGGPATEAQLKQPHSVCFDGAGLLYICDIGNHRIRRVDLESGTIETYAGTGERKPTPNGAPVAGTPLNGPRALAFDGENHLWLALREGNAIYRIDLTTQTLHHVAGTGKAGYSGDGNEARKAQLAGPKGVVVTSNDVFFADTESHTIRAIDRQTNIIRTVVGDGQKGDGPDGQPLGCRLDRPHGIEATSEGVIYIGDSNNHRVRRLKLPTN